MCGMPLFIGLPYLRRSVPVFFAEQTPGGAIHSRTGIPRSRSACFSAGIGISP